MSKEEYKRYIDHSIPFKYNCNGHLIHDCIKNPNRDEYEIMLFIQPKSWMLRAIWNHIDIPIVICPWCETKLNMDFAPEGKRYEVIEKANELKQPKISIYHTGYEEEDFEGIFKIFGKENVRIFNNEPKGKKKENETVKDKKSKF